MPFTQIIIQALFLLKMKKLMDNLFRALKKYHFIFVDSRTSNKSVAKNMLRNTICHLLLEILFIDNEENYKYIQNQLKQAIDIAKNKVIQ